MIKSKAFCQIIHMHKKKNRTSNRTLRHATGHVPETAGSSSVINTHATIRMETLNPVEQCSTNTNTSTYPTKQHDTPHQMPLKKLAKSCLITKPSSTISAISEYTNNI